MTADGKLRVQDNRESSRYEGWLGERLAGVCDYELRDEQIVFPHTVTFPEFRGRGFANDIVAVAVADAESRGLEIVPTCWFVGDYLKRREGAST